MDVKAVAKHHALNSGHLQGARAGGFLFKFMQAERIRGEQTVVAHVPPGRMTRVLRMIENGDPDNLAIHRTVVVAPRGAFEKKPAGAGNLKVAAGQSVMFR